MGRYRTLENHLNQLRELEAIISSMKTLAQLELHKIAAISPVQHHMADTLQQMADDFLCFFPHDTAIDEAKPLWLLLGSERGFCGDFNEALVRRLQQECPDCHEQPQRVLAVGRKLWGRLEESLPGYIALQGANVSEELAATLTSVVASVQQALAQQEASALRVVFHGGDDGEVVVQHLLPLSATGTPRSHYPPLLQLAPQLFFGQFVQHYLFLRLTELFTVSLRVENYYRVQHLEGAVRRLDERLDELAARSRSLRQEEITEEIEMILLGTGSEVPMR